MERSSVRPGTEYDLLGEDLQVRKFNTTHSDRYSKTTTVAKVHGCKLRHDRKSAVHLSAYSWLSPLQRFAGLLLSGNG